MNGITCQTWALPAPYCYAIIQARRQGLQILPYWTNQTNVNSGWNLYVLDYPLPDVIIKHDTPVIGRFVKLTPDAYAKTFVMWRMLRSMISSRPDCWGLDVSWCQDGFPYRGELKCRIEALNRDYKLMRTLGLVTRFLRTIALTSLWDEINYLPGLSRWARLEASE